MSAYNFTEIEKKWRETWETNQVYKVTEQYDKPKYYVLDMFPYPSGAGLHVGHPLGYIASDVVARFKRLQGFNVLHPMGFDAFGLPAEQYAIETGQHPAVTTDKNIERYKEQLKNIGFSYDWDREVKTCDPNYYKWTQWIFLKLYDSWFNPKTNKAESIENLTTLYENGKENQYGKPWNELTETEQQKELTQHRLAYKDESYINWCEALGTVLANDEVVNGVSERGGHPVERKLMSQWFLRITKYADRLLEGLETVDFPDSLKEMQKNWIGRSEGASVNFKLAEHPDNVVVFTTRPDTIFGVSFMVLAPEHPLVDQITSNEQKTTVADYVNYCKSRSELERKSETKEITGAFTGAYVQHPFTGKNIPIYVAEYVLMGYGTGAIMAVPCGDSRDHAFALKFGISIPNIFEGVDVSEKAYEEKTGKIANSSCDWFSIDGLTVLEAKQKVLEKLEDLKIGTKQINYRMRDAGFSRQRYWGEPFPISYNNEIAVADTLENLPITLPEVKSYKPSGDGKSPLSTIPEWVNMPKGNIRETDTMPGYAGSSWYYLRYMDPQNPDAFCDKQKSDYWQQVDLYIGGAEHAVGHLLYSRMWCKVLHDLGYINFDEPYKKLVNQGMIGGVVYHFYYDQIVKKIYSDSFKTDRSDLLQFKVPNEYVSDDETFSQEGMDGFCNEFTQFKDFEFIMDNGTFTFEKAITKMSKRLRNVVNPDQVIAKYGADTFRMYEMFLGPIDQDKPWNTKGIDGVSRFIKRFWAYCIDDNGTILLNNEPANEASLKIINRTLKKIAEDIEKYSFNTCVSSFMICLNELQTQKCRNQEVFEKFLIMLSPFAPHTAEELWHRIGNTTTILDAAYPAVDEKYLTDDTFNYPISINGKTRIIMPFALDADAAEIEKTVLADSTVIKWIEDKPVKKFILVKGRIVNVVV
jgi:leucyl-tRNA synthetase